MVLSEEELLITLQMKLLQKQSPILKIFALHVRLENAKNHEFIL